MVWQRAGTVSVQNGSTTVTGAGVDFAASSRVGDSFVGPDGATYEVANVASATVISILPAYKGATVSGAAYAIMPVQGYDKMLSDAFNSLNNQFGSKLAALGTTGNYDTLPVAKGGTGGADAASARAGLELGDAARANFGEAPGNAMRVGAFGLGNSFGGGQEWTPDLNAGAIEYTRIIGYDDRTIATPRPNSGGAGVVINLPYVRNSLGNNYGAQLAIDAVASEILFRTIAVGWTGWRKVYHTGNTTRAADGTLKAI